MARKQKTPEPSVWSAWVQAPAEAEVAVKTRPSLSQKAGGPLRIALAVLLALGAASVLVVSNSGSSEHASAVAAGAGSINTLTTELGDVRKQTAELPDAGKAQRNVLLAFESATAVAGLQNQYNALPAPKDDQLSVISRTLTGYFAESSRDNKGFDARNGWLVIPGASWKATPIYDLGGGTSLGMLWQLRDDASGTLLGWASADFTTVAKSFDNVQINKVATKEVKK